MKKKVIAGVMSMMMVMAMAVPAFAMDDTENNSTMEVTYTAPNVYEISIPAKIELLKNKENKVEIGAEVMNIAPKKELRVTIAEDSISDGKVTLERKDADDTTTSKVILPSFTLESSLEDSIVNDVVAVFRGQECAPEEGGTLYFEEPADNLKAGTWTGQITFQISIDTMLQNLEIGRLPMEK